jgi:hypothetical protein
MDRKPVVVLVHLLDTRKPAGKHRGFLNGTQFEIVADLYRIEGQVAGRDWASHRGTPKQGMSMAGSSRILFKWSNGGTHHQVVLLPAS